MSRSRATRKFLASRPIYIGISTSFEAGEQRLRHEYVRAVERAGGTPLILPVITGEETAAAIVDLLDAIIITGGPAISMGLVGDRPEDLEENSAARLASDLALLRAFSAKARPILGICYGMQLLNALDGGTIYGDVQHQVPGVGVHGAQRGATEHRIRVESESMLWKALRTHEVIVNSRHIQALASVGPSFRVTARAEDGVIEAIESHDGRVLGLQFHPERMDAMLPIFRYFVDEIRRRVQTTGTRNVSRPY